MNINVEVTEKQLDYAKEFGIDFAYLMLNIGVMLAPFDTGNLRSSITISRNDKRAKQIRYNTMVANYTRFLEEGAGPVKKHKGFISVDTKLAIVEGVINLIKTGEYPFMSTIPTVELKDTENLFSKEKQILKAHDIKTDRISANVRRRISQMREREYRSMNGIKSFSVRGLKVETTKSYAYGSNRGSSALSKAYQRQIKGGE